MESDDEFKESVKGYSALAELSKYFAVEIKDLKLPDEAIKMQIESLDKALKDGRINQKDYNENKGVFKNHIHVPIKDKADYEKIFNRHYNHFIKKYRHSNRNSFITHEKNKLTGLIEVVKAKFKEEHYEKQYVHFLDYMEFLERKKDPDNYLIPIEQVDKLHDLNKLKGYWLAETLQQWQRRFEVDRKEHSKLEPVEGEPFHYMVYLVCESAKAAGIISNQYKDVAKPRFKYTKYKEFNSKYIHTQKSVLEQKYPELTSIFT